MEGVTLPEFGSVSPLEETNRLSIQAGESVSPLMQSSQDRRPAKKEEIEEEGQRVDQSELLRGEKFILSRNANVIIKRSDYNLGEIIPGTDFLLGVFGKKGMEGIGGRLHLTNYRLIFKSHSINRVTGKFSIFLSAIKDVKDTSVFLSKKIAVSTQTQIFEFVL